MIDALLRVLTSWVDVLFGAVTSGVLVALFLFFIYRSSMHAMYLYGRVTRHGRGGAPGSEKEEVVYRYSFVIQNLENESFSPFSVRLLPMKGANPIDVKSLYLYAGPKKATVRNISVPGDDAPIGVEIAVRAMPAFDTWRVELDVKSRGTDGPGEIELQIGPAGAAEITPSRLFVDVRPRKLRLCPSRKLYDFAGTRTTPGAFHRNALMLLAVFGYLSVIKYFANTPLGSQLQIKGLSEWDLLFALLLGGLVWVVAKLIERPIYPVIEGYQWRTSLESRKAGSDLGHR